MEQHLGHRAYYLNLRETLERIAHISTQWIEVTYKHSPRERFQQLPPLPRSILGSWVGRQQILNGLNRRHHDALFFNTQVPAALIRDRLGNIPYVISTDITPLQYDQMAEYYHHRTGFPGPIRNVKHAVNQSIFMKAYRVLPWSTWTAESLIREYAVHSERVEVVAPGVDTAVWRPGNHTGNSSRPRILFVGGDLERKGGLDVLDVFKTLPVGSAELVLITRTSVPETPGVRVINYLQPNSLELIELYQSSDIFVLPSQAEAFGIAVAEASAAGLPAITTGIGGLKDIVLHQQTGFVIQPGNQDQLKSSLNQLLEDESLRRMFGQAARTRAEECFDAKKNAHRILEVILEACNQ